MSNMQISILFGCVIWVLLIALVCLLLSINRRTKDQRAESVPYIVHESRPMPLDTAYVRGLQAGTRNHVRAGSIE